jgi:CRISPR type III-B/RAMP module-associated protein Cmr3
MQIVIRPMDVWLFRDGKPFMAGEDHAAETLFPPSPFTLQGAIRTKVLADKGVNLAEFAKNGERNPDPDVGYGENFREVAFARTAFDALQRWQVGTAHSDTC